MRPKLLLRIAAVAVLLHAIGHTLGTITWDTDVPNSRLATVITGMKTEHFDFGGRSVSLGAFFVGYGYSMLFVLLFLVANLWMLSIRPVKNMIILNSVLLLALFGCEWLWFFPLPAVLSLIAAIASFWAATKLATE